MYPSASYTIQSAPTRTGALAIPASDSTFMSDQQHDHISTWTQKLIGNLSNLIATVMSNRHSVGTANCQTAKCAWVLSLFWWKKMFWHKGHTLFLLFFISFDFIVSLHRMFFDLVFGKNKKVNTAREILYFYICWFYFAFLFIYLYAT